MPRHINVPVEGHSLVGTEHTYRPGETPYVPSKNDGPGTLIIAAGMTFTILAVFHNWNGIEGLTIYYIECFNTGERTHISPREAGMGVPA